MSQRIFDNTAKASLRSQFEDFKKSAPRARAFDAAQGLGVSEMELVAAGCVGHAVRLHAKPSELLSRLAAFGPIMALTRNEYAVIEKDGHYDNVQVDDDVGLVHNGGIDLRLFLKRWSHAWAVETQADHPLRSLQFFDGAGTAVHKVYLRPESDVSAYEALVASHRVRQEEPLVIEAGQIKAPSLPDDQVNVAEFHRAWRELQDTHEFFGLIRRHKLQREQALRLAEPEFARPVQVDAVPALLQLASARSVPIMVFVGNESAIEIHTGPIENIKTMGSWFNVLDEGFSLHLQMAGFHSAWIVRKPTADGIVTSVECFAQDGTLLMQLFGERKPGKAERSDWRDLVATLTK